MMNTETPCQGWRCEDAATQHRTRIDGRRFDCCDFHARNFDVVSKRDANVTPEMLAEMRAERELESRVS